MKIIKIDCDDRYEAEKLAGMTTVQKDGSVFVEAVLSIIGTEVVLRLRDKSSHSVTVKDHENLQRLKDALAQVALGKSRIVSSGYSGQTVELALNDVDK